MLSCQWHEAHVPLGKAHTRYSLILAGRSAQWNCASCEIINSGPYFQSATLDGIANDG